MRRSILFIVALSIIIASGIPFGRAEGLFPSMNEMLGIAMPSVSLVINKKPDKTENIDERYLETYYHFDEEEYQAFGQYLAGIGAKISRYNIKNNTMEAHVTVRDANMLFSYDWSEKTAYVTYLSGTRAETELELTERERLESILPPIGGVLPSAQFAIYREEDKRTVEKDGISLVWNNFTDEEYNSFRSYLGKIGAEVKTSTLEAGVLKAEVGLNSYTFFIEYNWNTKYIKIKYPNGTTPETKRWNPLLYNETIFPDISQFGLEFPNVSMAIERIPSSKETLPDGSLQEIYEAFDESDYKAFSQYLQQANCTIVDYFTDDNGDLVINLGNGSGKMTFIYDVFNQIGIAMYPSDTRVERGWVPPLPEATTPISSYSIEEYLFTEDQCYQIAADYLRSIMKNPDSLQIHTYKVINYDETYCFVIDFSAQNSFGGYTRSEAHIWIVKTSGRVYFSDIK